MTKALKNREQIAPGFSFECEPDQRFARKISSTVLVDGVIVCDAGLNVVRFADGVTVYVNPVGTFEKL